jgi:hypothetical protein
MLRRLSTTLGLAALISGLALGGCASQPPTALSGAHIPADRYAQTFQAARETLRDHRFGLDRVDAPQGVLTTASRASAGAAKPWEAESGSGAAVDDLLSYQDRTVQVAFVTGPAPTRQSGTPVIPLSDPDRDLVTDPRETTMLVRVTIHRVERPGRRISMDSVRVGRQASDPALVQDGLWPSYLVEEADDDVLAAQLLRAILARSEHTPKPVEPQPASRTVEPPPTAPAPGTP